MTGRGTSREGAAVAAEADGRGAPQRLARTTPATKIEKKELSLLHGYLRTHLDFWCGQAHKAATWSVGLMLTVTGYWLLHPLELKEHVWWAFPALILFGGVNHLYLLCCLNAYNGNWNGVKQCEEDLSLKDFWSRACPSSDKEKGWRPLLSLEARLLKRLSLRSHTTGMQADDVNVLRVLHFFVWIFCLAFLAIGARY